MRKELFFCSAVLLSATLAGCGYDDGKPEPLAAIASECTTNLDCKSGNAIVGDCVLGKCLRFCSIETAQDDCESGTVCEGGLCKPIVPCPELQVSDSALVSEYRDKKCVQVFSTTPGVSWAELLQGDILVNETRARDNESPSDFASSNYDFAVPHDSLYAGMNFSVVTLAAITYLRLLITTASSVAECTKPQVKDSDGKWVDDGVYIAPYAYSMNDAPMTPENLQAICSTATTGMVPDMSRYVQQKGGKSNITQIVSDYTAMIREKPVCLQAKMLLQILEGISSVVMEMGMSSVLESTTLIGAQQVNKWLTNTLNYEYVYDNSPSIYERAIKVGANQEAYLKMLALDTVSVCNATTWKINVQQNAQLKANMNNGFHNDANAKDWETCDKNKDHVLSDEEKAKCPINYKFAKDYKRFCSLDDASEVDNSISESKDCTGDDKYFYEGKCYVFKQEKANDAMETALKTGVMQSQIQSCNYMMLGMSAFPLLQALAINSESKFSQCARNEYRIPAMLDITKFQDNPNVPNASMLMSMLQGDLSKLDQNVVDTLGVFANKEVIYENFTDPTLIWLSAESPMPLEIREKSDDYTNNDLILKVDYSSINALFKKSATTGGSLAGSINMYIIPENPEKYIEKQAGKKPKIIDGKYLSQTLYKENVEHGSATGIIHRSGKDQNSSNCKNCRFYFYATSQNENVPMVCGGFTYKTNQINGYIVLNDDDLNNRAGKRDRITAQAD